MRQIAILSGLLAVALGASYLTWTSEEVSDADQAKIVLLQADESDLQKLVWKTDTVDAVVESKTDGAGDYLWVTVSQEVEVTPEPEPAVESDEPAEEGPAVAPEEEPEPEPEPVFETKKGAFKGNKSADGLWNEFTPLYALRELEVGSTDRAVFGFDKPYGTLEVHRKSGPVTLTVGAETYGSKDRYVELNGKVYLVDDKAFRALDKPESGLIDRLLQPNLERAMTSVTVAKDGRTLKLVQKNKDDASAAYWAPEGGEELGTAATLVGNLARLRVSFYPAADEVGPVEERFKVTVDGDDGRYDLTFSEGGDKWYIDSTYNRARVEVVTDPAKSAAADITALFEELP